MRDGPTASTIRPRSANARSVSSPTTTWLAPQASTSSAPPGVLVPASTSSAPAKPVSKSASSRISVALHRAALDGVEIGDVALAARRASPGRRAAAPARRPAVGRQARLDRREVRAVAGAGVDRDAAGEIEDRNDLHAST